jgi:UDP-glucose 4-epimerase
MILVTGAAGFVGAALCSTLRARGIPFSAAVRRDGADGSVAVGDMNAATDWSAAVSGCDTVIHLAARVHVMNDTRADPLAAYREVNVDGTLNLARQAAGHGVKRFVFVSSVKVNGESTAAGRPFTATDVAAPRDPYGQSKLEAELALQELGRSQGMEIVVVRPPLVYGPGVRANFLKLMQLVKWGVPLPFGAAHNCRSMVALDNLIDLLLLCADHREAAGRVLLVSDDHDLSVSGLITMIAKHMGKRAILLPVPAGLMTACARAAGKANVADRLFGSLQVDIAQTKTALGWRPVVDAEAAVRQTVLHFLSHASR